MVVHSHFNVSQIKCYINFILGTIIEMIRYEWHTVKEERQLSAQVRNKQYNYGNQTKMPSNNFLNQQL